MQLRPIAPEGCPDVCSWPCKAKLRSLPSCGMEPDFVLARVVQRQPAPLAATPAICPGPVWAVRHPLEGGGEQAWPAPPFGEFSMEHLGLPGSIRLGTLACTCIRPAGACQLCACCMSVATVCQHAAAAGVHAVLLLPHLCAGHGSLLVSSADACILSADRDHCSFLCRQRLMHSLP